MYPLKVILVGCGAGPLPDLQQELANQAASLESEFSDVKSVIGHLPLSPGEKRLFIMQVESPDDLKQLERLNDTYIGCPVLALVNGGNDLHPLLEAVRAGAAQVVPLPAAREEIAHALARIARQFGFSPTECKLIAVSGVTGGAGTTTIAINLASEIAAIHGVPTVLMELGHQVGKLAVCLNLKPRFTTQDLLSDPEHMDINLVRESLTSVSENLHILAGPYQSISPVSVSAASVLRLLDHVRQLARIVIVDMPYSYDELYFAVCSAANQVVLVAQQKVPSVHSLIVLRHVLEQKAIAARQHLVVNRYDPFAIDLDRERLCELLQVTDLATIRNDYTNVSAATNNGRPLRREAPCSPALDDIDGLAARLLGVPESPPRPQPMSDRVRHLWHQLWR